MAKQIPLTHNQTDELDHYLDAREALIATQKQLAEPTMWGDVLDPSEVAPDD